MIWASIAAGLALGADWRRLGLLALALALPLPTALLVGYHCWRERPDVSSRAPRFCDAIATELRAGATFRAALDSAARSVDATRLVELFESGASVSDVAEAAREEFAEIGDELNALLTRTDGMGVAPAALFDEMGSLALAQVDVAHEVATASAPAKATGVVLLIGPSIAILLTAGHGLDGYLAQPAQRAAALAGIGLTLTGLVATAMILRSAR
ncbi:MAG: hypothetical protein ACRDZM_08755 [Acidimicrobiia bacterium]